MKRKTCGYMLTPVAEILLELQAQVDAEARRQKCARS
jgi:hypothetical protein